MAVSALRSSDGAILDPDDRLADVVDDREQLAACLTGSSMDGTDSNRLGLNLRGDGTSASSNSGSPSPDFLRHHNNQYNSHQQQLQQQQQLARKDIEVTGQEADHLHSLQVRRGSEPALNCISPGPHSGGSAAHLLNEPSRDYKVQQLIVYCLFFLFAVVVAVRHRREFSQTFCGHISHCCQSEN